ncbi:MAG: tyrosine--tRNA ligase [Deltaproteobacteria bacterium]|nr:MAG: tyrosine--tRNA ligase [Deltaproteobacteria bacterium]
MQVLEELDARGFIQQTTGLDSLREHLDQEPRTLYVGIDPTADSLHVGHTIPLLAAALLQRAGHKVVVVIGGGTAMVGDPSGKTELRAMLSVDEIQANARAIERQVGRLITLDDDRGRVIDNAEWLRSLGYINFLREIGRHFSVNRMLTVEAYKQRLERGLSFIEFNYQLLQAYDFLVLYRRWGVTLQIGGDDQWANILAGTDLIRREEQGQAHGLTFPLVTTASGAKMGKTAKGAVWLDPARTPPFDFYQYWINIDDRDVGRMLRLFTLLPLDEIATLEALQGAAINQAKRRLAYEVTARMHGVEQAERAHRAAGAMVAGQATAALPTFQVPAALRGETLVVLLAESGLCKSRGDARRQIQGGAVRLNNDKVLTLDATLPADVLSEGEAVLRVGKKKAARLVLHP